MSTIKKAQTQNPVLDIIKDRWSARSFSDKLITPEVMDTLLEAASWSFSGNNEQPWRYAVAYRGTPLFDQFFNLLSVGNQPWCKDAAALVLSLGKKHNANGNPNVAMMHDIGSANMLLTLQANSHGIYTHVLGGYDVAKANELFNLESQDLAPVYMIALGYLDEADKLIEPFKTREVTPRSRKSLEEIKVKL